MAPPVTLMMFTLIHGSSALNATVAFTTLSLVVLLCEPVQELIHAVPMLQTALASLDRIQDFLLLEAVHPNTPCTKEDGSSIATGPSGAVELSSFASKPSIHQGQQGRVGLLDATVSLGKDPKAVLQGISFVLARNSVSLVIGPVGCGKSTLLRAMVGDAVLARGHRATTENTRYAYCSQDAWLPNRTVRQIITAESDADEAWYATVVEACALNNDIATLPCGHDTIIGNKGVSLSGGQRQRLALARALFSRGDVLVVDDVLSGLDANTGQFIFDRVFGPTGLCKKHGFTALLATHSIKHMRAVDHIIALGEGGRIQEQGSFMELEPAKGYVHELSIKGTQTEMLDEEETVDPVKPVTQADKIDTARQDLARRTGDVRVYAHYAKSVGWFLGTIVVSTALGFGVLTVFPTVWVRWWAESTETDKHQHPLGFWSVMRLPKHCKRPPLTANRVGIYFLFGVTALAVLGANIWVMLVTTVPKSSARLHEQLLLAVMKAPYSFFVKTDSGVTLNRFSSDMNLIETEMTGAVMMTISAVSQVLASAGLIAAGAQYVGVAIPVSVSISPSLCISAD